MSEMKNIPEEVQERLRWYAEQHSVSEDEAAKQYLDYIEEHLGIVNLNEEDEDFLVDAAETFVVERRVMQSPGGSAMEWVGCFIAMEPKMRDKREKMRLNALSQAGSDLSKAIDSGVVARAFVENSVWMLEKANGIVASTQERFVEGEDPWFLVRDSGMTLCLLQNNPDWARHGEPIAPSLWSRTYRFYGNEPHMYADEMKSIRIDVGGSTEEDVSQIVKIGQACKIQLRPQPDNVNEGWEDVYRAGNNFFNNITYTDDFVEESDRAYLKGEILMGGLDCYVGDLTELMEVYQNQSETIPGYDTPIGPLVCIKGKVTDINRAGYDTDYDPYGKDFTMRVSSFALQREFASDMWRREVSVRVHGLLGSEGHAFDYEGREGWKPYAIKSTVYIFGRLGVRATEDGKVPNIKATGIYVPPRLAIPAGEGGDTSLDQFSTMKTSLSGDKQ
jgi:hypothetical protein